MTKGKLVKFNFNKELGIQFITVETGVVKHQVFGELPSVEHFAVKPKRAGEMMYFKPIIGKEITFEVIEIKDFKYKIACDIKAYVEVEAKETDDLAAALAE